MGYSFSNLYFLTACFETSCFETSWSTSWSCFFKLRRFRNNNACCLTLLSRCSTKDATRDEELADWFGPTINKSLHSSSSAAPFSKCPVSESFHWLNPIRSVAGRVADRPNKHLSSRPLMWCSVERVNEDWPIASSTHHRPLSLLYKHSLRC